jgi:hypothetical protein
MRTSWTSRGRHVTPPRRLAACLLACLLVAPAGAGVGLGAAKPSPKERSAAVTTSTTGAAQDGSDDGGTPLSFGLLLGGLAAAILLLGLAALPATAAPRLAGWRDDRRLDMALAGALTLLVVTVVYLSGAL